MTAEPLVLTPVDTALWLLVDRPDDDADGAEAAV